MGFFDTDVRNGFDALFDMNRDGKLDLFELGCELQYLDRTSRGLEPWDDSEDDSEENR